MSKPGEPLPGLGPRTGVPTLAPGFDWRKLPLDAAQGFVLSRIDGRTNLGEICLLAPFPETQTVEILGKLHVAGAIDIPGQMRPAPPPRPKEATRPAGETPRPPTETPDDGIELPNDLRSRIDEMVGRIAADNPFALLEVSPDADKKDLRRAYFKLSKDFHPDRYFGRKLGPYQRRLQELFTALSAAFELLSDDERRVAEAARAKQKSR